MRLIAYLFLFLIFIYAMAWNQLQPGKQNFVAPLKRARARGTHFFDTFKAGFKMETKKRNRINHRMGCLACLTTWSNTVAGPDGTVCTAASRIVIAFRRICANDRIAVIRIGFCGKPMPSWSALRVPLLVYVRAMDSSRWQSATANEI